MLFMSVYKDKESGKWLFRVYATDPITNERVQHKRMGFELKRDAIEAESRFLIDVETRGAVVSNMTMDQVIDEHMEFVKQSVKITTFTTYTYLVDKHIRPYFKKMPIRRISRKYIQDWYRNLDNTNYTQGHKTRIMIRLKTLFKFIENEYDYNFKYIENLPKFKKTLKDKKPKIVIYDEEQFNKFLEHTTNILERVLFSTLFLSGMRISELRGLRWYDINFDKKTIDIKRQLTSKVKGQPHLFITPKSESSIRTIHIPNELLKDLEEWYELRSSRKRFKESWQVFGDSGTIHENSIRRMLNKGTKAAGLPHITLHQLRHSYTTLLFNKNVPPEVIKEQLGHTSIQVTLDIYTHITDSQKGKAIDKAFETPEKALKKT